MKLLLTGASSMTGMWIAERLAAKGHMVIATFTRDGIDAYAGDLRARRVSRVVSCVRPEFGCRFGDDRFLELIASERIDAVCHHGADVTNYRSPDFDPIAAVASNGHRAVEALRAIRDHGGGRFVLTGSVFEQGEGAGSEGLPNVSPYGMSKAFTSNLFRYYAQREGVALGRFVIANPFGPFEEPRFTNYLMETWRRGDAATVRTPLYVRDNAHASLLAACYERFVSGLPAEPGYSQVNPSGYVESQGAFTQRYAAAMRTRLGLACEVEFATQTEFTEPRVRINTEPLDAASLGFDESVAWDENAEYYAGTATE